MDVQGRVAFVTGGSNGIGLGIAEVLLEAGMSVIIGYRTGRHRDEAVARLAGKGPIHATNVDVTDRNQLEAAANEAVEIFGKVHVLVCNAGVQLHKPLTDTSYEDWDRLMGVNFHGVFNTLKTFLPLIREHGEGGHIVTTASTLGLYAGNRGCYSASKFAVVV